ncbi:hypothetical protein CHARACLAT_016902 [Characodon lateralis]|uniref:Uncharacterized protein n=1 Tax=Characodon lateralis TaxID=208331 RepID=A0ABU7EAB0_9TELE|nr:hypothetical protein [Characodon lateralis]
MMLTKYVIFNSNVNIAPYDHSQTSVRLRQNFAFIYCGDPKQVTPVTSTQHKVKEPLRRCIDLGSTPTPDE